MDETIFNSCNRIVSDHGLGSNIGAKRKRNPIWKSSADQILWYWILILSFSLTYAPSIVTVQLQNIFFFTLVVVSFVRLLGLLAVSKVCMLDIKLHTPHTSLSSQPTFNGESRKNVFSFLFFHEIARHVIIRIQCNYILTPRINNKM